MLDYFFIALAVSWLFACGSLVVVLMSIAIVQLAS